MKYRKAPRGTGSVAARVGSREAALSGWRELVSVGVTG